MAEQQLWGPKLELGVEEVDREHHLQLSMLTALTEALENGHPLLARRILDQLAGYSAAHFRGEELLMESASYADLEVHRQEHRSFLVYIDEIRDLLGNAEEGLALPMAFDLQSGLVSHISSHDRAYVEASLASSVLPRRAR